MEESNSRDPHTARSHTKGWQNKEVDQLVLLDLNVSKESQLEEDEKTKEM